MSRAIAPDGTTSHLHARRVAPMWRKGLQDVPPARLPSQRLEPCRPTLAVGDYPKYAGAELRAATRPGAEDHRRHPSRIGNARHFLDGRVVHGGAA
jgi:hypothetical protein